uniref:Uncharacterized protein n=1 Tax=Panagrolaimus superbus TaxID=310955 RepID=A0A914XRC4_9BILA
MQDELSKKNEQIAALHQIILLMQQEKAAPTPPRRRESYAPTINEPRNDAYSNMIVVTNIPEQIDAPNEDELDKAAINNLIKNIDPGVEIDSLARMGRKTNGKKRSIKVKLQSNQQKKAVLSKAPTYIKSNPELLKNNTFINSMRSPESHRMQVKLQRRLNELRKDAKESKMDVRLYIQRNQIHLNDISNPEKNGILNDAVNEEVAAFYKQHNIFRGRTQSTTSDFEMH